MWLSGRNRDGRREGGRIFHELASRRDCLRRRGGRISLGCGAQRVRRERAAEPRWTLYVAGANAPDPMDDREADKGA
jgi:hypothetical protein